MKRVTPALFLLTGWLAIGAKTSGPVLSPVAAPDDPGQWDTLIDSRSFSGYAALEEKWNYLYPWGKDHNGSARMYASATDHNNVTLLNGNILRITANYITSDEGKSNMDPHLPIRYHSGTIHAKHQVTVSDKYPVYELSGSFKAPVAKGSWPAFWITSVKGWPPESDILEFKGDDVNWQNTFITPQLVATKKTTVPDAGTAWHTYKAVLKKADAVNVDITYYVDDKQTSVHRCNFMNQPMWIIINLQMEGSSAGPGPVDTTYYYIKDVLVRRSSVSI